VSRRGPYIKDRRLALAVGYVGIIVGALALYDAYENRGARRPFLTKLLPGG
jgi:succinate-acetate transporter protein